MGKKRGKMTTKRSRDEKEMDIEEIVEKSFNVGTIPTESDFNSMKDANTKMKEIRNSFKNSIKVDENDKIINEQNEISKRRLEALSKRKEQEIEKEKRRVNLLKTISKIEEKEKQEKEEQQR